MESRYVFKTSKGCQKPISELLLASLSQVQNHSYENEVSFTCKATRKIAPAKSAGLRELEAFGRRKSSRQECVSQSS